MENINQHLLIDISVSNKYIDAEIGDVVYLEKIENKLGLGYKYWAYEVINGQLLYPYYMITEINKVNNKINIKLRRLHRLEYGLPKYLIDKQNEDNNYVLPDSITEIKNFVDRKIVVDKNGTLVTDMYEPISDDEEIPVNEQFLVEWTPDNSANVLYGDASNAIRLNVLQSEEFGFETETWTSVIEEDDIEYDGDSPSFSKTQYIDESNNHNGYVILTALSENNEDTFRHGKIKIISSTGKIFTKSFQQIRVSDTEEDIGTMPDVNGDGVGNILDVIKTMQYILGNETFTDEQIELADVNGDGGVNVLDIAIMIGLILE
jgi:hypothetical protein